MSILLKSKLLIIGNGEVIKDGMVKVDGNKITYCGPEQSDIMADETMDVPFLMPGLVECHAHFAGIFKPTVNEALFIDPKLAALRSVRDVKALLRAGFTTVREVGGLGISLNNAIQEGSIIGPRIYAAGKVISSTGGHGDAHDIPLDIVNQLSENGFGTLCDGVSEAYKAVRSNLRAGAEVIKFCASGGVLSKIDHPMHQQFSAEEQKAIVDEANRAEVAVAAHCHGYAGIKAAIEAGVTTIEHGTYLNEELADLMIKKNVILVPTRYVVDQLGTHCKEMGVPDYGVKKFKMINDIHLNALKLAITKGVKIALGTDIFVSGVNPFFEIGNNAKELELLVDAGMTPMEALVAGTSNGIDTLGKRAPKAGLLKEGYDADILLLNDNPLEDIKSLQTKNFKVMKSGKIVEF